MRHHDELKIHGFSQQWVRMQEYLAEFIYGGIDGSVTTFAVVAGGAGAGLSVPVVIILGFANLLADGLSMSIGAYLSSKAVMQEYDKQRDIEYWEVDHMPEKERQEVREIYQARGFEGELLEKVVEVITADRDRWVDVMMKDELEMIRENKTPLAIGVVTFISFVTVGFIPLISYVFKSWFGDQNMLFLFASIFTGIAFILIGWMKSFITKRNQFRGIFETLVLGTSAAVIAYFVGDVLEMLLLK